MKKGEIPNCGNCLFFVANTNHKMPEWNGLTGECRCMPPTRRKILSGKHQGEYVEGWPQVIVFQWCGQHPKMRNKK